MSNIPLDDTIRPPAGKKPEPQPREDGTRLCYRCNRYLPPRYFEPPVRICLVCYGHSRGNRGLSTRELREKAHTARITTRRLDSASSRQRAYDVLLEDEDTPLATTQVQDGHMKNAGKGRGTFPSGPGICRLCQRPCAVDDIIHPECEEPFERLVKSAADNIERMRGRPRDTIEPGVCTHCGGPSGTKLICPAPACQAAALKIRKDLGYA